MPLPLLNYPFQIQPRRPQVWGEADPLNPQAPAPPPAQAPAPMQPPMSRADTAAQEAEQASQRASLSDKNLMDIIARQPDRAKGARGVIGNILSVAGPILGGGTGQGLGVLSQKLLYPGMEKWQRDLAMAQLQSSAAGKSAQREETESYRRANEAARTATLENSEQNRYRQELEGLLRRPGAQQIEAVPGGDYSQTPYGMEGAVREVKDKSGKVIGVVALPSPETLAKRKRTETQQALADKTAEKEAGMRVVDEAMLKKYPNIGKKLGDKISDEDYRAFADNPNRWQILRETDAKGNVWQWRVNADTGETSPRENLGPIGKPQEGPSGSFMPEMDERGTIIGYYNPVTGERRAAGFEGGRRTGLSETAINAEALLGVMVDRTSQMADLGARYKSKMGPISGRVQRLKNEYTGEDDPDAIRLFSYSDNMKDMLLRARSGAQINEQEYSRLERLVPDPNKPYNTFETRRREFEAELKAIMATKRGGKGPVAPSSQTPTVPNNPTPAPSGGRGSRPPLGSYVRP